MPQRFYRIWTASTASALGDGIYFAAFPLLALDYTHNPVLLGVLEACSLLPWLFFGLIGGALVDRWDRRRTMVTTDLLRFSLLALVTVLVLTDHANIYLLFATAFLLGTGQVLFDTAGVAYLPEVLDDRDLESLQQANARLQGAEQALGGFVGPPTGSLLFTLSRSVPLLADALSFLVSSLTIWSLPKSPAKPETPRGSLLREAREGAAYLFGNRVLVGLALRPGIGNFAFMACNGVMVLFLRQTLHLGTTGYGVYLTANALGAIVGAAVSAKVAAKVGTGTALTVTALVEASALLGIGVAPNAWAAAVGELLLGTAMGVTMGLGPAVRQAIVPDELMGRVTATARLIALGAGPLGAVFGGWLAHAIGLRAPFIVAAALLASTSVICAGLTNNRRIEAALAEAKARRESGEGRDEPESDEPESDERLHPDEQPAVDVADRAVAVL